MLEKLMKDRDLQDSEDIDFLLEVADLVRQQIGSRKDFEISALLNELIQNNFYEAFSWTMELLQEEFEKKEGGLGDFVCQIGRFVTNFDEFADRLQMDSRPLHQDTENAYDTNGEIQSFSYIRTYQTKYKNIFLLSSENFDTKDNDYIQYRLLFTRNPAGT
jgi:hypothetical protein